VGSFLYQRFEREKTVGSKKIKREKGKEENKPVRGGKTKGTHWRV